jgi:hypothetical protein
MLPRRRCHTLTCLLQQMSDERDSLKKSILLKNDVIDAGA